MTQDRGAKRCSGKCVNPNTNNNRTKDRATTRADPQGEPNRGNITGLDTTRAEIKASLHMSDVL